MARRIHAPTLNGELGTGTWNSPSVSKSGPQHVNQRENGHAIQNGREVKRGTERLFAGLVAKHPLGNERTGPPANQRQHVQRALGRPPSAALSCRLVRTVSDKRGHARNDVQKYQTRH